MVIVKEKYSEVLYGIAIDNKDTLFREDCYSCVTVEPNIVIFRVMVALPPVSKLLTARFNLALRMQLKTNRLNNLPDFFAREDKEIHTFSLKTPRPALVTEYVLNGGTLVSESLYPADVQIAEQYSYEEYSSTAQPKTHLEVVATILRAHRKKRDLLRKFEDSYVQKLVEKDGVSSKLIYGSLSLFNQMCRGVARKQNIDIPYVSTPKHQHESKFRISTGYANFNRAFRDPCALINLMSLVHFLTTRERLFEKSVLAHMLEIAE